MNLDLYAERHGVMVVYDDIPASQAISVPGAVCLDYSFTAHDFLSVLRDVRVYDVFESLSGNFIMNILCIVRGFLCGGNL